MALTQEAQEKLDKFFTYQAKKFGGQAGKQFTVTPSAAQNMEQRLQKDASWFYQEISLIPTERQSGQVIQLESNSLIGGTVDTLNDNRRIPKNINSMYANTYDCITMYWDTAIKHDVIDAWSFLPDFPNIYNRNKRRAIANSRIACGFNGRQRLVQSNLTANPLLQDVNEGWLFKLENFNNASQYIDLTAQGIQIGGTDIPNLDLAVFETKSKLGEQFLEMDGLVAIVSLNLLLMAEGQFYADQGSDPRKKLANEQVAIRAKRNYAGLPTWSVPYFPSNTILVTYPKNLQIYYLAKGITRIQRDNPDYDQVEDFLRMKEDYAIGEYFAAGLMNNISVVGVPTEPEPTA